jgi:predicted nuclease of predicted toxin-antitoxin system
VRILLDEQLPRQLAPYLAGHDVHTVKQQSWTGLKNGELLAEAEAAGFAIFLTGDQNLEFQQNLSRRRLGVVVLRAVSNALEDLIPLVPAALRAIENVQPGDVARVQKERSS